MSKKITRWDLDDFLMSLNDVEHELRSGLWPTIYGSKVLGDVWRDVAIKFLEKIDVIVVWGKHDPNWEESLENKAVKP